MINLISHVESIWSIWSAGSRISFGWKFERLFQLGKEFRPKRGTSGDAGTLPVCRARRRFGRLIESISGPFEQNVPNDEYSAGRILL
jgi:hypothetical protein